MPIQYTLAKKRIISGAYDGVLKCNTKGQSTPALEMIHLGEVVGEVSVEPIGKDGDEWAVRSEIPKEFLIDGVQTFLFVFAGEADILDRFAIVTGQPLEDDIRGELDLLRAELDMLKRAFRRHCTETM